MELFLPDVTTYWPDLDLLVLVDEVERDVAGDAAADDALRPARLDHRVDVALLVSDEQDLRCVRVDLGDAADETLAVDHRVVDVDPVVAAGVDRRRGVPGAGRARDHARRHQLHILGEDPVLPEGEEIAELLVLGLRRQLVGETGLQLLDLLLERFVLRLGAEQVADPVPAVAERLGGSRGTALQRRDDPQHTALYAVRDTAVGLAEIGGEQRDGEQQQDCHDDPPPEYAPAIHRSARGGTTGPAAGSCACS